MATKMNFDLVVDREDIEKALDRMAAAIHELCADAVPIVVTVMNGALVCTGNLLPRLTIELELDFVRVTRYHSRTVGAELNWLCQPELELAGRTVVLIDDVFDEGITLKAIVDHCRREGAANVITCVLVEKLHDRKIEDFRPDFIGLEVADRYLLGFGMDYENRYRNLPGIYALKSDA